MDDLEQELTIKIYNDTNTYFEINTKDLNINLEQIKKECKEKFKYEKTDIEKMDLWYIDEDNDKNLINNENELMLYAEEMDSSKYFINLNLEITKKKDKKEENVIEEGKEKDKDKKKEEKYYNDELEQKNNLIVKLQKEIEFLNSQLNYHKDRNKKIILKYEEILDKNRLKNLDEKKDDLNNNDKENNEIKNDINNNYINNKDNSNDNNKKNLYDNETDYLQDEGKNLHLINSLNSETETKTPLNNKNNNINNKNKEKEKQYDLKKLEFINNRCKKCDKKTIRSIYKCIICVDYFLCETCYKTITKNKIHEHIEFFHIIYPNGVVYQLEKKEIDIKKLHNAINAFYGLLNKYFFDKNGNIIVKEINNKEIGKIKQNLNKICKEMINFNADPGKYFCEYQHLLYLLII